jgi:WhiB family redox-sensing transcriptional regulator
MSWKQFAACAGMDAELFMPSERGQHKHLVEARRICGKCLVSEECLVEGESLPGDISIRAGLTVDQRRRLRRRGA